ncbi:hypothetical protein CIP107532_01180 [Corynebacterium diphtheriae]|nr:hypothetical protein CIP107532_01180 [Corynebacterium diphtheriae]
MCTFHLKPRFDGVIYRICHQFLVKPMDMVGDKFAIEYRGQLGAYLGRADRVGNYAD